MRWSFLLPALLLAGCGDYTGQTKMRDLAGCQMKADEVYPHWKRSLKDEDADALGDYVELCMTAKGYLGANGQGVCNPRGGLKWEHQTMDICYRKPWPWEHM